MSVDFDKIEANAVEKVAAEKAAEQEANSEKSFSPDPKLWITFSVIAVLMVAVAVYIQFFM